MSNFDPKLCTQSTILAIMPEQSLAYLEKEFRNLLEMLDGAEDCKWIYQFLIQLSQFYKTSSHKWPFQENKIRTWIEELRKLDTLRSGRWNDLEQQMNLIS